MFVITRGYASHQALQHPQFFVADFQIFQGQVAEGEGERKEKSGSQMKARKIQCVGIFGVGLSPMTPM